MQKLLIFQQNGSCESKIQGIRKYGGKRFTMETISIDSPLPSIIDDTDAFFPVEFQGDLVLDFLYHPDLSLDLSRRCQALGIPVIASGKKIKVEGTFTPPT